MDLDQQIQELYAKAPQDGTTPNAVMAIAPALKQVAGQLKHPQYYVLQTLDERWVTVTLNHQRQTNTQKNVLYAFATLADAKGNPASKNPQVISVPVPVTHILFQMVAMTSIDSIIFFDIPGNLNKGSEVHRDTFQKLIQMHLQQMQQAASASPPADMA